MAEKTKSLEKMPGKTLEASSPTRMPPPSVSLSGFGLAAIQGAAGNMAIQRAAREVGGEDAPVRSESALNFLHMMSSAAPVVQKASVPKAQAPAPAGPAHVPPSAAVTASAVQAKLAVSQPTDPDEREADRVADAVAAPSREKCGCQQGQPCHCSGQRVQRKAGPGAAARTQRPTALPPLRGGQPLAERDRSFFEGAFGRDFRAVHVHTDADAAAAARSIGARAFTAGHDVVFGAGEYGPSHREGRRLLAHELTHVMQQAEGADPSPPVQRAVFNPAYESTWSYLGGRLDRDQRLFLDALSATPEKALQIEQSLQKEGEPPTPEKRALLVARIQKLIQLNAVGLMASHRATVEARQEELWNAPKPAEGEAEGGKPGAPATDPVAQNAAAVRMAAGQVLLLMGMKEKLDDSRRALNLLAGEMLRVGGRDFIEVFSDLDRNTQFLHSDAIEAYFRQSARGLASAGRISKGALVGLMLNMGRHLSQWRERQLQGVDAALYYLYQAFPIFGQMETLDFARTVLETDDRRLLSRVQMAYIGLLRKIDEAIAKIGAGGIHPYDLPEAVRVTSETLPPALQKILEEEIKDRQMTKFWIEMGLTFLQAALVFVPVVGPFLAAGVGLVQIGAQVEDAFNRESLASAATNPERELLGVSGPSRLEWAMLAVQTALTVADLGAAVKSLGGRPHVTSEGGPQLRAAEEAPHGVPGKGEPARPPGHLGEEMGSDPISSSKSELHSGAKVEGEPKTSPEGNRPPPLGGATAEGTGDAFAYETYPQTRKPTPEYRKGIREKRRGVEEAAPGEAKASGTTRKDMQDVLDEATEGTGTGSRSAGDPEALVEGNPKELEELLTRPKPQRPMPVSELPESVEAARAAGVPEEVYQSGHVYTSENFPELIPDQPLPRGKPAPDVHPQAQELKRGVAGRRPTTAPDPAHVHHTELWGDVELTRHQIEAAGGRIDEVAINRTQRVGSAADARRVSQSTRPDLQIAVIDGELNGRRIVIEYDKSPPARALKHARDVLAKDPNAIVILKIVGFE